MPNVSINTNITEQLAGAQRGNNGIPIYPNGNYPYSTFGYDQFNWFLNDIARVDRGKTPWVIVGWHQPQYNSYQVHYKEFECGRLEIEPFLYANGVDIVMHGAACSRPFHGDPTISRSFLQTQGRRQVTVTTQQPHPQADMEALAVCDTATGK